MKEHKIPPKKELLWPTLKALEDKGGSASIQELSEQMASNLKLPDEILAIPHKDGPQTKFDALAAWARTDLKRAGAIENPSRGIWTITETGRRMQTKEEMQELVSQAYAEWRQEKQDREIEPEAENDDATDAQDWQEELLGILRSMPPDAFERLCQRILRESGFTKVEVTGRSGDGGIDGAGVLRVKLISFHVRFQCKRYSGSVGASDIRNFRGAMAGRGDKGLFLTTGRFTKDAQRESVRDGAPAIDLIDGADLCSLLKDLGLGVSTETVEVVKPKRQFFEGI